MSLRKKSLTSKVENVDYENGDVSILDLPELALESILEKLPPSTLCSMAGVCTSLREKCISDHLWKKHMKQKWGRVVGSSAYREWQWHIASKPSSVNNLKQSQQSGLMRFLSFGLSFSWSRPKVVGDISNKRSSLPYDSVMAWYLALEKGRLWFPAQVYNRQNGNVGFVLSCYDAELCYDSNTDTFQARYPPHGRRSVSTEQGVKWERIRAPPVQTPPHNLHVSDCLNELRPGDHIEIQWRRNKEFPYGWWYGVVGHLETCDGNDSFCTCHNSENVILEFNQYALDSQWRRTIIDRKDHQEEGNEADGFYGGIRKLYSENEISTWRRLWPNEVLD